VKKTLFFICFIAAFSARPAQSSCANDFELAKRKCDTQNSSSDASDKVKAAGEDIESKGASGTGAADSDSLTAGSDFNSAWGNRCQTPAVTCLKSCQSSKNATDKTRLSQCQTMKRQADQALQQADQNKSDAEKAKNTSNSAGNGGMPQMPQSQSDQNQQQQPQAVATPASTDSTDCTANPAAAGCTKTQTDSANNPSPASFDSGGGGGGSSDVGSSGSIPSYDPMQMNQPLSAPSSTGVPMNSSGGGTFGSNNNVNGNKELTPGNYADAAKDITNVLNGERGGGGGAAGTGGGFSGYGTGSDSSSLSAYLPGGRLDPTKKKVGGNDRKPASNDVVASMHENIFNMISKRMQILCKLKEIRDCD
jgi:hypothetical protein